MGLCVPCVESVAIPKLRGLVKMIFPGDDLLTSSLRPAHPGRFPGGAA